MMIRLKEQQWRYYRRFILVVPMLLIFPFNLLSNIGNFEGKIKFLSEGAYDTLSMVLSVKNDLVRMDQYSSKNGLEISYLFDLRSGKVFALSGREKVYKEINLRDQPKQGETDVTIIKSQNSMLINGTTCYQWRVKNRQSMTEITYWVAQSGFDFMEPLQRLIGQLQTPFNLFTLCPDIKYFFPLMVVDRTAFRKFRCSLRVVDIKRIELPENLFAIPRGYRELLG